jgi:hypothetical protein
MSGRLADPSRDSRFTGLIAIAGVVAGIGLWILTATGWLIASAIAAAMIPAPDPERSGPPFC